MSSMYIKGKSGNEGTSLAYHLPLPLMNNFNNTEADIHPCKLCILRTVNTSASKYKHKEPLHLSIVKSLYITLWYGIHQFKLTDYTDLSTNIDECEKYQSLQETTILLRHYRYMLFCATMHTAIYLYSRWCETKCLTRIIYVSLSYCYRINRKRLSLE